jgi:hypothetical protein
MRIGYALLVLALVGCGGSEGAGSLATSDPWVEDVAGKADGHSHPLGTYYLRNGGEGLTRKMDYLTIFDDDTYVRFYYDDQEYEGGDVQGGTLKFLKNSSGRQIELYNDDGTELRDTLYYRLKGDVLSVAFDPDADRIDMVKAHNYEVVCQQAEDCARQGAIPDPACAGGSWQCEYVCVQLCQQGREEWIQAVKDKWLSGGDSFNEVSYSEMPKSAQAVYDGFNRVWGDSFPPSAYKFEVEGQSVFYVQESHDGGFFGAFFDADGFEFTGGSAGESSDWSWCY